MSITFLPTHVSKLEDGIGLENCLTSEVFCTRPIYRKANPLIKDRTRSETKQSQYLMD